MPRIMRSWHGITGLELLDVRFAIPDRATPRGAGHLVPVVRAVEGVPEPAHLDLPAAEHEIEVVPSIVSLGGRRPWRLRADGGGRGAGDQDRARQAQDIRDLQISRIGTAASQTELKSRHRRFAFPLPPPPFSIRDFPPA